MARAGLGHERLERHHQHLLGWFQAIRALRKFGNVDRNPYHNLLVMAVAQPGERPLLARRSRSARTNPIRVPVINVPAFKPVKRMIAKVELPLTPMLRLPPS